VDACSDSPGKCGFMRVLDCLSLVWLSYALAFRLLVCGFGCAPASGFPGECGFHVHLPLYCLVCGCGCAPKFVLLTSYCVGVGAHLSLCS